jgi:SAM-dependent methyltransferase
MNETEFIEQYKEHHEKQPNYGLGGPPELVYEFEILLIPGSKILDYGCGKGQLLDHLEDVGFQASGYDPGIEKFSTLPSDKFDAICCNDVLEHIPEEGLEKIFQQILGFEPKFISFNIGHFAAEAILPNGSNAHETIRPMVWWRDRINHSFEEKYFLRQIRQIDHISSRWLLELQADH